jgi:uncharacterized RDD family membrane protein YckC
MWRYWSKVHAEDHNWQQLHAQSSPVPPVPIPHTSFLGETPPPLPIVLGGYGEHAAVRVGLASIPRRIGARLIDTLILVVIASAVAESMVPNADDTTWGNVFVAILAMAWFLTEVPLIAFRGQTLGKMAVGTKVSKSEEGENPGLSRSLIRWISMIILVVGFPFGLISYLLAQWSNQRQTWYDKAAGTLVMRVVKRTHLPAPIPPTP